MRNETVQRERSVLCCMLYVLCVKMRGESVLYKRPFFQGTHIKTFVFFNGKVLSCLMCFGFSDAKFIGHGFADML